MKRFLAAGGLVLGCALAANADPIASLNIVFNGTNKSFTAGITTNTAGSGQIWVQAFFNPDANQTINLELLKNGVPVAHGMSPTSLATQGGVVTYGFPSITPLPITFYHAGTGLTIRATVAGSTITKESATFDVAASSATKILVLAPGMSHVPGTNPALTTGKAGGATSQTPMQGFPLTVIITDNSFNRVQAATHTVAMVSGDLTVYPAGGVVPAGQTDFNVTINGARTTRAFTASDITDGSVLSGSVEVTTVGPPEQEVFPFPSPFNPNSGIPMTFRFHRNDPGQITLKVKNQLGQSIWEHSRLAASGFTDVAWDGRNENGTVVAAGVYYILLEVDGSVKSKKRFGVIK